MFGPCFAVRYLVHSLVLRSSRLVWRCFFFFFFLALFWYCDIVWSDKHLDEKERNELFMRVSLFACASMSLPLCAIG